MTRAEIIFFSSIAIILVTSWVVVNSLTPYGSATSPDSVAYLDIANNIKNGHGFTATDFSLDNAGKQTFTIKRYWPPLYADLLSVFIDDASDVKTVSIISRILLAISIVFVFFITYESIGSAALLSSLLLCITVPIITIYTYAWSETLFIPILIIIIWASIEYLELSRRPPIYRVAISLILLTMLIMLAYTRYIGIAFAVLLPVIYFFSNRDTLDRILLPAAALVYITAVGYLLYENYIITGYISGMARPPSDETITEILIDVYHAILTIFPTTAIPIISALIITASIVYFIKTQSTHTFDINADKKPRLRLYILSIVTSVYLIAIISLRSFKQFDMLDVRLLSPALATLFILLTILPSFFKINSRTGLFVYLVSFFYIASLSINGYEQWLYTSKNWKAQETPRLRLNNKIVYNNFTKSPETINDNKKLFSMLTQDRGIIVIDKPLIYKFITGAKVIEKPKHINSGNFLKINSLPAGSLLLLNKHEFDHIINNYIDKNSLYKYINIGNFIGLQLPVKASVP